MARRYISDPLMIDSRKDYHFNLGLPTNDRSDPDSMLFLLQVQYDLSSDHKCIHQRLVSPFKKVI